MLRITTTNRIGAIRLQLEGSLAGPWVDELSRVADRAFLRVAHVDLDLTEVGFVDDRGTALLCALVERGAVLQGRSRFVAELLEGGCHERV